MKNRINNLLFSSNNQSVIEKQSIFWNMLFSVISALQSAIMILIVTRVCGTEDAGIVSIAFATAYLMFTIATYGLRNFHATDSLKKYSFKDYRNMRILSCSVMLVSIIFYCNLKEYYGYKRKVIFLVCILKLLEAIEDLYHGELQRLGRLDIACKVGTYRLLISYISFIVALVIKRDICFALGVMNAVTLGMLVIVRIQFRNSFFSLNKNKIVNVFELIKSCFPLFVSYFFSIYITNSPKYAIDKYLLDEQQAYYAIISMPVFTINLISGVIYRPQLLHMSELWNKNKTEIFKETVYKQIRNIIIVSILVLFAGVLFGLKLLEKLYNVDLDLLKMNFILLLFGGGMVSLYNFLSTCITIMRKQKVMIAITIIVVVYSYVFANRFVYYAGLMGASIFYFMLMTMEMVMVLSVFLFFIKR